MTNKNDSTKPVRVRTDPQKPDSLELTTRPALFEVGTLDDGTIVIKQVIGPTNAGSLRAERRVE